MQTEPLLDEKLFVPLSQQVEASKVSTGESPTLDAMVQHGEQLTLGNWLDQNYPDRDWDEEPFMPEEMWDVPTVFRIQ